ncbi:uroporphyrinogen-III C-methyltransferase [Ferrimonas sediminum]|uniref:uroporphyrinogen-III C-methyltransferase n=1 Tax=Ferrimonas sediminum TaxID=718193 RepID=A0A1G8XLL5_9GAMM|nr:uroporphyrinogen-III C-methyltransferase [Ferrimonas sediminum]SDJ91327.1 uroporphyrinogen-III C-methyltransferase [Ferrimonas sediminum]
MRPPSISAPAQVSLIGAGPGDPELLTLKAMDRIQQADVILYDNLVSEAIRARFPDGASAIYVGKKRHNHALPQAQLNQRMVALARQGHRIVRLKGGDPFVFGRGSEELLALHRAGVVAEVIPGITAASGCGSYAGIPLTHRGLSQSCTLITGQADAKLQLDWAALAKGNQTLVFYMGLNQLPHIRHQLSLNGMSDATPVALVENGCRPEQRVIITSLTQMATDALRHNLRSPTLIYIGEVVRLADSLRWWQPTFHSQQAIA